jgi:hypothetical protein
MAPRTPLEKIPVEFRYQFRCAEVTCRGQRIMCTYWEVGESYRRWRDQYGERWEAMFRQRYERDMIEKNDTHFYVGNIHQHRITGSSSGCSTRPCQLSAICSTHD